MKTKISLLVRFCLLVVFTAAGCKDDAIKPKEEPIFNGQILKEKLLGEWYKVGSTNSKGIKVIFTETNVTAFRYTKNYKNPDLDTLFNDTFMFYDNAEFNIISYDTMKFQHYPQFPEILEHTVAFTFKSEDTLWIDKFDPNNLEVVPPLLSDILLVRTYEIDTTTKEEDTTTSGNQIIDAVQKADILHSSYLDTIFSRRNQLIPFDYTNKNIYTINSEEELNQINPFDFQINIDFSKYTLISGSVVVTSGSSWIQEILLEERDKNYLFSISVKYPIWQTADMNHKYFWRLYPKLKANKNIVIEVSREEE